jgi:hypothetical protein
MSSCFRTCVRKVEEHAAALRGASAPAVACVLAACAGAAAPARQGGASGELRQGTRQLVETFGRARLECERLTGVHTDPMPADRPVAGAPAGARREYWTVTGCDQRAVFEVTYVPGQDGGTGVEVQPWGEVRDASCPPDRSISSAPSGGIAGRVARAGRRCF